MFSDFLQRSFTDDGEGSGVLALAGLDLIDSIQSMSNDHGEPVVSATTLIPLARYVYADRQTQGHVFNKIVTEIERMNAQPLWMRPPQDAWAKELEARLGSRTHEFTPVKMFMPSTAAITKNGEWIRQTRDATLVAIALELFRRAHGTYPASLDELVPAFLPAVPPDRHTGKPLNYERNDGNPVLYSVGVDLDDDGGKVAEEGGRKHGNLHVDEWKHPVELEKLKHERPASIPDGDWILYPPSIAKGN